MLEGFNKREKERERHANEGNYKQTNLIKVHVHACTTSL